MTEHLESWGPTQFSAMITQAFWVPHHALPAWIGAVGYLYWHRERWPLTAFLAPIPLLALWSPFALLGLLPFIALACLTELCGRRINWRTPLAPAITLMVASLSLLYLSASGETVGFGYYFIEPGRYWQFQLLETAPYLVPLFFCLRESRDRRLLMMIGFWLLLVPFMKIGPSSDFTARASMPGLALLAYLTAAQLTARQNSGISNAVMVAALTVGSFTGMTEIARAVRHSPAPVLKCALTSAYDQSFAAQSQATYLTPLAAMPRIVRPVDPAPADESNADHCWSGEWFRPSGV
jgi:hypothetical protein